jgi:manganese/zinc/iron transport system permease protein
MIGDDDGGADLLRILLLLDYNTRIVLVSAMILGAASGVVGTFLLLRKRALMGDVLSHAMLPGVVIAFLVFASVGLGKSLPILLCGAAIMAIVAMGAVMGLRRLTALGDDAIMAIILGSFFGLGALLLGVAIQSPMGNQAGLESFIYGKAASMTRADLWLIIGGAVAVLGVVAVLFKELRLLCFDEAFAGSIGRSVSALDALLLGAVITMTLVGLQAVGLILIIALLVIPPSAARFWTDDLRSTVVVSGLIGAVGCWGGVSASAMAPKMPAGAMIVLALAAVFVLSALAGRTHGLVGRGLRAIRLKRAVGRDHVLRALYELRELGDHEGSTQASIVARRSWSEGHVSKLLAAAAARGEVLQKGDSFTLSTFGVTEAASLVRNHRLWEEYLIRYAHLASSHVDRAADRIEHVLGPEIVLQLERDLERTGDDPLQSPHEIQAG